MKMNTIPVVLSIHIFSDWLSVNREGSKEGVRFEVFWFIFIELIIFMEGSLILSLTSLGHVVGEISGRVVDSSLLHMQPFGTAYVNTG